MISYCASSGPALSIDSQDRTAARDTRVLLVSERVCTPSERCEWYKHVKHTDRDITLEFTTSCSREKGSIFFVPTLSSKVGRGRKDKDRHLRCRERETEKDTGTEKKTQLLFFAFYIFFSSLYNKRTKSHPFSCNTIYCVYGLRKLRRDGCSSFTRWCLWTKGTLNGTTFKCSPIHYSTNTMGAHLHTGSVSRTIRGTDFFPRRVFASTRTSCALNYS